MKYCPNPACPTLIDLGMVAEYEDRVDYCDDCGALLISADSPPQISPQPAQQPAGQQLDFGEEAALLGTFESQEDVDVFVEECERAGIPVLVEETTITQDMEAADADEAGTYDVAAFNLIVRKQDMFRAMNVLDEMFGDAAADETDDDADYDEDDDMDDE